MDGGHVGWLAKNNIQPPPDEIGLALSKDCIVGLVRAKHLRFSSDNLGLINLFIHVGDEKLVGSGQDEGRIKDYRWVAIEPRPGVSVVVLFDNKVTGAQVTQLVRTMFPELSHFMV
jgi:hypothetical protein